MIPGKAINCLKIFRNNLVNQNKKLITSSNILSELKDGIYELENKYLSESENGIDKLEIYKPKNKNNNKNRKITVKVIFLKKNVCC
jgi:hypothetical protein